MSVHNVTSLHTSNYNQNARISDEAPRKRKWDDHEGHGIDTKPFTIRNDTANPFAKPRTFTPLSLIPRSRLPLAYLDTTREGSRLFAAHLSALEDFDNNVNKPNVLIAHDDTEERMYAIERVQYRKYALCRLGHWVAVEDITERARMLGQPPKPKSKRSRIEKTGLSQPWWSDAIIRPQDMVPSSYPDILVDFTVDIGTNGLLNESKTICDHKEETKATSQSDAHQCLAPVETPQFVQELTPKLSSPEELLEDLTKHYLDALYLSRTPLSYFVKGPLARTRTAFTTEPSTDSHAPELTIFLREAILSTSIMDKKYSDGLMEQAKGFSHLDLSGNIVKPRKKRKWKPKRDKMGLFVNEQDHIEQWWRNHDEDRAPSSAESVEATLKRRLPSLRLRETFLQIIVILEVMAIEAQAPPVVTMTSAVEFESTEGQAHGHEQLSTGKKPKKKKDADLKLILDNLIDYLCIWHSLDTSSPTEASDEGTERKNGIDDGLRSFCTEVILPFFMYRIPERASNVSKKLGGPSAPTPVKRKSSGAPKRPGEPATRQAPEKKARKPLTRVSTDTFNHTVRQPPSLQRSATDTDLLAPLVKRESIAVPTSMEKIPLAKPRSRKSVPDMGGRRVSLLHQVSFSKREVDLSAMSQASEAKVRRKAEVEQKLREAITTLKKPNRTLAVEEIAKNTDESFAKVMSQGRASGSAQTKRKSAERANPITITSTPHHVKSTPARRKRVDVLASYGASPVCSSVVPSSSTRPRADMNGGPAVPQTGHRPRHSANVIETPSRGFAKFMPLGLVREPGTLLESPTAARTMPIAQTPFKPLRMAALVETPVAKTSTSSSVKQAFPHSVMAEPRSFGTSAEMIAQHEDSSMCLSEAAHQKPNSIYDALGWDDDYDALV